MVRYRYLVPSHLISGGEIVPGVSISRSWARHFSALPPQVHCPNCHQHQRIYFSQRQPHLNFLVPEPLEVSHCAANSVERRQTKREKLQCSIQR